MNKTKLFAFFTAAMMVNGCGDDPKPEPQKPVTCPTGFTGEKCDQCAPGYEGEKCTKIFTCVNGESNGQGGCECKAGFAGDHCNICAAGYYGKECQKCPNCGEHGKCDDSIIGNGSCKCESGWSGDKCQNQLQEAPSCPTGFSGEKCDQCAAGYYGPSCTKCNCAADEECDDGQKGSGQCTLFMTDADDNKYPTVNIGGQIWTAENIKLQSGVACYNNPDAASDFVNEYGCLYNWEDANKVCPSGWHLPSDQDIYAFKSYLSNNYTSGTLFLSVIAKSAAWGGDYSMMGSDEFGFGALPAGYYSGDDGEHENFGFSAFFWLSSKYDEDSPQYLMIEDGVVAVDDIYSGIKFSVRCLKNTKADGSCTSDFTGDKCSTCAVNYKAGPNCNECSGNFTGLDCRACKDGYYGLNCEKQYYGTVEDVNGNTYKTVNINGQIWMAEDLRLYYDDDDYGGNEDDYGEDDYGDDDYGDDDYGDDDYGDDDDDDGDDGYWDCDDCDFDEDDEDSYTTSLSWEDAQNICPAGWHLPSVEDFESLVAYVEKNSQSELPIAAYYSKDSEIIVDGYQSDEVHQHASGSDSYSYYIYGSNEFGFGATVIENTYRAQYWTSNYGQKDRVIGYGFYAEPEWVEHTKSDMLKARCLKNTTVEGKCSAGFNGADCTQCNDGFTGQNCNLCQAGKYGENCEKQCSCGDKECEDGLYGRGCLCADGDTATMIDADNNSYGAVCINKLFWMTENMKQQSAVTCMANTDVDSDFVGNYGCLYSLEDAKKVCPDGWRLPSNQEALNMKDHVQDITENSFLSLIAKSTLWKDYSEQGTDNYGFGALPGGYYDSAETQFVDFGIATYFWVDDDNWLKYFGFGYGLVLENIFNASSGDGLSVRCVKE